MSLGDYDEDEHERREQKSNAVDTDFSDDRTVYEGSVEYDTGESTEELLAQFDEITSE
ncbi:MAG: DUF5786 family protein [Halobacteriales archaeon]